MLKYCCRNFPYFDEFTNKMAQEMMYVATATIRKLFLTSEIPLIELDRMIRTQFSNETGYSKPNLKEFMQLILTIIAMWFLRIWIVIMKFAK